jgi:hypothetical protein
LQRECHPPTLHLCFCMFARRESRKRCVVCKAKQVSSGVPTALYCICDSRASRALCASRHQVDNKWDIVWAARQKVEDVLNRCHGGRGSKCCYSGGARALTTLSHNGFADSQSEKSRRRRGKLGAPSVSLWENGWRQRRSKLPKCRVLLGGSEMHVMTW